MRARRLSWSVPVVTVLLLVGLAVPANATIVTSIKDYSYSQNRYFRSAPLNTCFTANLSGKIHVVFTKDTASPSTSATTKYYLYNPKLNVQARNCTTGALKKISKWSVRQSWWDYRCALNPSLSAGSVWALGVSITPNCGSEDVARRSTSYGAYSSVTQNNSGLPVKLGTVRGAQSGRCFSASVRTNAYIGGTSDTFSLSSYKICYSA